jgi:glycosyltransferase involved in cell wall biosynthesis
VDSKINKYSLQIYILSRNRCDYLREAINSVLSQSFKNYTLIVSDNSDDDNVQVMMFNEFPNIDYIRRLPVIDAAKHFEEIVKESEGEFILLLHDDDRVCNGLLREQLKILNENQEIVAISSNGYLIDTNGNRKSRYVIPLGKKLETYNRSSQVAMRYSKNSCIPLSPTIYRSSVIKKLKLREELGKVLDAALFCDLADIGLVAINPEPLYECRVHSGQDSSHIPLDLLDRLEIFFETRKCISEIERSNLHLSLKRQHAERYLKKIIKEMGKGNFSQISELLKDNSVTFVNLCYVIFFYMFNKIKILKEFNYEVIRFYKKK